MLVNAGSSRIGPDHTFEREPGFPHWTIGCSDWGVATRVIVGERTATGRNRLSLIPPDTPYRVRIAHHRPFETWWAVFDPPRHWLRWLRWPRDPSGQRAVAAVAVAERETYESLLATFRRLVAVAAGRGPHRRERSANALEALILQADELATAVSALLDPRLEAVLDRIDADLAAPLRVADLAAIAEWSPSRFAHRFAAEVGQSPRRYVEGRRMDEARSLLLGTGLSVAAIAQRVGFEDPLHFSTRFRAVVGSSPSDYRRGAGMGRG